MIQYVKARLYNKANGTFVGNGIFIKRGSIADPTIKASESPPLQPWDE